jgi:hypothetical protein
MTAITPNTLPSVPRLSVPSLRATPSGASKNLSGDVAKASAGDDRRAREALDTLHQLRKGMVGAGKGAAVEKLRRAKQKLELLRMAGGDPKSVARQAQLIAQEIRAAAADYGAAGNTDATPTGNGAPEVSSAADPQSGAPAIANESRAEALTNHVPSGNDSAASAAKENATPELAVNKTDDMLGERATQAYQNTATQATGIGKSRGDQEILEEFKSVARLVRRLINDATHQLNAQKPNDPDAREAQHAATAMDLEIQNLSETMQTGTLIVALADSATFSILV